MGETKRKEEAESRIRGTSKAPERAANEAKRREVKEALRRVEEGDRAEVQRLTTERRIKALENMDSKSLEADLQQEAELWKEAEL